MESEAIPKAISCKGALAPGIDVAALSIPRGQGKTWLAGLPPGARSNSWGFPSRPRCGEYILCATTLEHGPNVLPVREGGAGAEGRVHLR